MEFDMLRAGVRSDHMTAFETTGYAVSSVCRCSKHQNSATTQTYTCVIIRGQRGRDAVGV